MKGWQSNLNETCQEMRLYWTFSDELAIIVGVAMKIKRVIIPEELQHQVLKQVKLNYIGTEKKQTVNVRISVLG